MENGDPLTVYRQFIEKFANKIGTLSPEDCETPFRLATFFLVPSEVEAECLEWIRRYLSQHDCPNGLLSQLSRAVYKNFEDSVSLSHFYLDSDDKGSDDNDDDDEEDDNIEDNRSQGSSDDVDHSIPQQIDASKLLQEVISYVHATVKAWNTSPPVLIAPPTSLHVCSHAIKNTRRKMEDRHVIITDLNVLYDLKDSPSQSYFSVFDGHGGLEAAEYAATHLHGHLVNDQQFNIDPASAMKQAYKTTDIKFLEKSKREGLRSGTTGVSVLIRDSDLYIGWLGDSQALLVRSGQPVQVMNPHKPEREDERRRIEDLGGCVLFIGAWRVNGNISVSRAIGDAPHKPFICSDADVTTVHMTGEEEYIILACDGLWDVLSPSQVTNIVYKHSLTSPGGIDDVAIGLVNAARDNGSSDNISVIVILFKSTLSVPQTSSDGGYLFGLNQVSDKNLEKFGSSPSVPHPKPPTLNDKLKSKAKGGSHDAHGPVDKVNLFMDGSLNSHHSSVKENVLNSYYNSLYRGSNSGAVGNFDPQAKPLSSLPHQSHSHALMRQAVFYVSRNKRAENEDHRIAELALQQAMSGQYKHRTKLQISEKPGHEKKTVSQSKPRLNISRVSHKMAQNAKGNTKGKRRKHKRGKSKSLAGEALWGMADGSDDMWSVHSQGHKEDQHQFNFDENTTTILTSWLKNTNSANQIPAKKWLSPIKGTKLASAEIAEAAQWAAKKNLPHSMELTGTSLQLSSRAALPEIMSMGKVPLEDNLAKSNRAALGTREVPRLGRGMSVLSDNTVINSSKKRKDSHHMNSSNFDTMCRYSESLAVTERNNVRHHHSKK